ncbi:1-deoxy-D-xylulose-5-phosphate synthase N-terminal domain-containing protein [Streptomyces sp. NPDC001617]
MDVERIATGIRRRVFQHTLAHNGGYLSQACSAAELLATLYGRLLNLGPSTAPLDPGPFTGTPGPGRPTTTGEAYHGAPEPDRDRFVFSPAHYALVLYAALIEVGRLGEGALEQFNVDGTTMEMIGAEHSPGFATTTGSLAQALSVAGGVALARRVRGERGRVWVFMSDGEFQEGQTWEAIAALAFHGLDNVTVVVDANGQQCDGAMDTVMQTEPLAARITAFGGLAREVDGHDPAALTAACAPAAGRPLFVVARTDPARGVPLLAERAPLLHYLRFASAAEKDRYTQAFKELTG